MQEQTVLCTHNYNLTFTPPCIADLYMTFAFVTKNEAIAI